mgnify:CR=1 FL=1
MAGSVHCDDDTSVTPLLEQDPAGVNQTTYIYCHKLPARTKHILVGVRFQATSTKGDVTPTLQVKLEELDGTEIDKGFEFSAAELVRSEMDGRNWRIIWAMADIRTVAGLGTMTAPRMLNVSTFQGDSVAVKITSTNCRVIGGAALSYVPKTDDQVFSA